MSDPTDSRHAIGGNHPPEEISDLALMLTPVVVRDQIELDHAALFTRRDELIEGVDRFFEKVKTIDDGAQLARASDFVAQIKLAMEDLERARKAEVKPLDEAKATHQKKFKAESLDVLDRAVRDIQAKITVYQKAEKVKADAIIAAERKRLQVAADQAAAAAHTSQRPSAYEAAAVAQKAADRGPASVSLTGRGTASTVSLREHYTFQETDLALIPREWLTVDFARIQAAIDAGLRDGEDGAPAIPGGKIIDDSKSVVRR